MDLEILRQGVKIMLNCVICTATRESYISNNSLAKSAGSKADVSPEAILPEGAAVSAGLMLPLSAAPDVREAADPAKLEDASEPLQLSGEDEAEAERPDKFWLPEEIAQEPKKKCPADVQVLLSPIAESCEQH